MVDGGAPHFVRGKFQGLDDLSRWHARSFGGRIEASDEVLSLVFVHAFDVFVRVGSRVACSVAEPVDGVPYVSERRGLAFLVDQVVE